MDALSSVIKGAHLTDAIRDGKITLSSLVNTNVRIDVRVPQVGGERPENFSFSFQILPVKLLLRARMAA